MLCVVCRRCRGVDQAERVALERAEPGHRRGRRVRRVPDDAVAQLGGGDRRDAAPRAVRVAGDPARKHHRLGGAASLVRVGPLLVLSIMSLRSHCTIEPKPVQNFSDFGLLVSKKVSELFKFMFCGVSDVHEYLVAEVCFIKIFLHFTHE